ncbi:MAG: PQQ-dependent sugar dehydrogenase, partial [Rhodothermales bacterium]
RFERTILADSLNEPTELEVLGNGRILFVERRGDVRIYDPESEAIRTIAHIDVNNTFEDGLIGVALDPSYDENNWIYLYYSPPGSEAKQHLSRFELRGDSLLRESEVVMLVVPTQRDECCHTGGSIEFGPDGSLFLSTGDNTNPFDSDGFAPIDERPGRSPFDAQRTSANTNDLRGKILRITPKSDGSYGIPEGNLFSPGTENARPEIYVMGNRNPYRISIDQKTGFLYWGEVGPDAGETDSTRGPRGHDEINQARRAGFFGWPYFVGDNKAYRDFNFATRTSGPAFDAKAPVNDSPNNNGRRELPPAQPAYIWYPYAESPEFPIVKTGGRNAMAGPVFHADMFTPGAGTFPEYFDGKLFIYDWMRGWILVATMDESGDLRRLEPFMPATRWNNPMDMAFDDNGILYVLEYGTSWFSRNPDARLNRVEYNPG